MITTAGIVISIGCIITILIIFWVVYIIRRANSYEQEVQRILTAKGGQYPYDFHLVMDCFHAGVSPGNAVKELEKKYGDYPKKQKERLQNRT